MFHIHGYRGNAKQNPNQKQNKTTKKYPFTPTTKAKIKKTGNTKRWQECGTIVELSYIAPECFKQYNFGELFGSFFKHTIPYDPEILFLGIYLREIKIYPPETCRRKCIPILFIIKAQI